MKKELCKNVSNFNFIINVLASIFSGKYENVLKKSIEKIVSGAQSLVIGFPQRLFLGQASK